MKKIIEILERNNIAYEIGLIKDGYFFKVKFLNKNKGTININIKETHIDKIISLLSKNDINLKFNQRNDYITLYDYNKNVNVIFSHVVSSHILIPKTLLSRFIENYKIFYIRNNKIEISSARRYNTKLGYYTMYFEKYLSENYENILGDLATTIDKIIKHEIDFVKINDICNKMEQLFRMTLFRNSEFIKLINEESLSSNLIEGGYDSEHIAYMMERMNYKYLNNMNYIVILNETKRNFVTINSMISNINILGFNSMIFPLDPKFAIIIVPSECYKLQIAKYGKDYNIRITEEQIVFKINEAIYNYAKIYNYDIIGYNEELEMLLQINS